jgi:glycosyltransferase involved in cell wall biosynthesis
MASFYQSLDVFCLSSKNEGFPNVVCEAMANSVPLVVTNAGDAADIVGDTGFVAPVSNSIALATSLAQICDLPEAERTKLGQHAGKRVREKYDINAITSLYFNQYQEVLMQS